MNFTPNWRSVNSINLKWNSWVTSSLEMAFTWIIIMFIPLLIGLLQLLFEMSNVFLNLPTFIDISLPSILQLWPLLLNWLERINLFLGELKWVMSFNLWKLLSQLHTLDSCRPFQTFCFGDVFNFIIDVMFSEKTIFFILPTSVFVIFFLTKINYQICNKELLTIVDAFEEWCHLFEGVQQEILCIQTVKTFSISWQLVFWIDANFNGHYPCFDSNLWSHITLGTNKGDLIHCPIIGTSCLNGEMKPMSNNVISFWSMNIFNFRH